MISMIEYALYRDDLKLNTQVNGFTKGSPFMWNKININMVVISIKDINIVQY